jgi:RNA polymerase sigma-70 factor (ECF subfamily)
VTPTDDFSDVMARLRVADPAAAFAVFQRFARALAARARQHLGARLAARVDPEDIVQSAYRSFFHRHADGQFQIDGWDSLWGLLVVITVRKCANQRTYHQRECRAANREVAPAPADGSAPAWQATDPEPMPEEAAMLAETLEAILAGVDPPERGIIELTLQGFTAAEIKERLGRAERTVRRVRERFREALEGLRSGG